MSKNGPSSDVMNRGLPTNVDAERFVLGSILLDGSLYPQAAGALDSSSFALEKHRLIFKRMGSIQARGEGIERVTVANELMKFQELDACDGLSYLVSLDDGLPQIPNLESYIRIVKDKSTLRRIIHASQATIDRCFMAEEEPADILAGAQGDLLKLNENRDASGPATAGEILDQYAGGLNAFLDPSRRPKGTSTGFAKLDEMTGGLHAGELFIIGARPSAGKTALALNIAQHVTLKKEPEPTIVFSLEMSRESLLTRMICATSRVDSYRFRCGYLNQDERRKLSQAAFGLSQAPLEIDDTAGLYLMDLHSKLLRLKTKYGTLGLVIVDYLQLMGSRGKVENRTQEISALSRGMKLLAKEIKVPMLVLSQLSRAVESRTGDHRPQLSDLRDGGSIEQDADVVAFVYRQEMYHRDREDLRGMAELILAKHRNGAIGTVNLVFLHAQTKFESRAEDVGEINE